MESLIMIGKRANYNNGKEVIICFPDSKNKIKKRNYIIKQGKWKKEEIIFIPYSQEYIKNH